MKLKRKRTLIILFIMKIFRNLKKEKLNGKKNSKMLKRTKKRKNGPLKRGEEEQIMKRN
jgi:hypothetical protein